MAPGILLQFSQDFSVVPDPARWKLSTPSHAVSLNPRPPIYAQVIDVLSALKVFQPNLLGPFAKLREATISFIVSFRLSVRMEQLGSHRTDFYEIWYLRIFRKYFEKIQVSLKSDKNKGYFIWRPIYIFIISHSFLLRKWNVSNKACRENKNTHFVSSNFFSKIMPFMRKCGKIL